jgi:DNA-binding SARP family transcriptional activator
VYFRVLGPLEVREHDRPLALGGPKQRALLALLLLNANEVVSSDRLIDELWGAQAPATAAKSLQVYVSQLRKVLEPGRRAGEPGRILVTRAPGYLLDLDPEQLDLERFKRLAEEGRDALAAGDPEGAAARLGTALALWRGQALADVAHARFDEGEISRLEDLRLAALEDRIEADLRCGRNAEAIAELERLVATEPLRERPRAQLMLALYRSARQAEALDAYAEARRTLVDELGIEPGRPLRELHAAILAHDPSLEGPVRTAAPGAGGTAEVDGEAAGTREAADQPLAAPDFVGRETELRSLNAALAGAVHGRGIVFLIGGEPGIGKSSLADQLAERAVVLGARVLWGRCWEAGGAPAYWPWVQSLRAYVARIEPELLRAQLGPHGGEVAHVVPELRDALPDLPVLESPESEGARFRVFDATSSFLKRAASAHPIVLVLEDLHAADASSLLLLQFIAKEVADARLLIVGTYRDIELGPGHPVSRALAELSRQRSTQTLLLRGISEGDVARLVEVNTGVRPSPALVTTVHRSTGGNPLFVAELGRLLLAERRLGEPLDGLDLRLAIPLGVHDVIARRLARVSDGCRETLASASVLGREFTIDALARAGGRAPDEVLGLLDEAMVEGVVGEVPGASGRLRFSHELIRDTLYDELGASRRMRLHRRIGEGLENLYADDPDPHLAELAHHFFEAGPSGDADKAYRYACQAGDRAARLLAYEEAVRLYKLAVRMHGTAPSADGSARCRTLIVLGEAQLRAGDEEDAKQTFLAAADLARKLKAPDVLAQAALGYGGRYWLASRGDAQMITLLEEALSALGEGDRALTVRLMARLACAIRDQPERDRRLALSEGAVEMARRVGDPHTLAYALAARCVALMSPDALDAFGKTAGEVIQVGASLGDPEAELTGHWYRVRVELDRGNTAEARHDLVTATRLAERTREPAYRWYPAGLSAALALFEGGFDEARELIAYAYELGRTALTFGAVCSYRLQLFILHKERGEPDHQEDALTRLAAEYETYPILRCALASLILDEGRISDARRIFEELARDDFARIYLDEEWLAATTLLAEVCWSFGDVDRAALLYPRLLPYRALNAFGFPETVLGSVERPLGLLAAVCGRHDDAEGHFERALEINTAMGARPWAAHTQHDHARMLIRRGPAGDPAKPAALLRAALGVYRELGMRPWEDRAGAELAGLG